MSSLYGWLDLSTERRPSWALICGQASGKEELTIVKRKGVYMTVENAKRFDDLDEKHKKIFKLMALPYELRHEILSYVCNRQKMAVFLGGARGPRTAVPLPSIARAGDRKLRMEVILVSIKQTTLEIHSGPGNEQLQQWLTSINSSGSGDTSLNSAFDAVHSLSFPYFSRYPHRSLPATSPNNDLQLMKKCRNLRKVQLTFVGSELDIQGAPKPLTQLRREYRLDSMLDMFQLGQLQTVVLLGPYNPGGGHPALEELAAWLREEYAIRANFLTERTIRGKALSVIII